MNIKIQFVIFILVITFQPMFNIFSQTISFTEHLIDNNFLGPAGLYVFDLDGDSKSDVVAAGIDGNEVSWWHNGGGTPIEWTKYLVDNNFSGAAYVMAGDVDGDSLIDIIGAAWDGKDKNGYSVDSGMYLYTFTSNNFSQTKKMFVIK